MVEANLNSKNRQLKSMLKKYRILLFVFLCVYGNIFAFERYSYVSVEVWDEVTPYLLPDDHPAKKILDRMFSESRVLLSVKSMEKAGFINPIPRFWTKLIVTKHPDLNGYVIKAYIDAQRYYKDTPEYVYWIKRIQGAQAIRELVDENHWNHLFKIPRKWIYALPPEPSPPREYLRKNFILIEEDMNILSDKANKEAWKGKWVTEEILNGVYIILSEIGLNDCAKIDNIPFSTDGRIAFIDTQSFHEWPVEFKRLSLFLSPSMKQYWKSIIKSKS